jgi:hypothetical protein
VLQTIPVVLQTIPVVLQTIPVVNRRQYGMPHPAASVLKLGVLEQLGQPP